MARSERQKELHRRRHRKAKLRKLRAKYIAAKTDAERAEIFAKARRVSPLIETLVPDEAETPAIAEATAA